MLVELEEVAAALGGLGVDLDALDDDSLDATVACLAGIQKTGADPVVGGHGAAGIVPGRPEGRNDGGGDTGPVAHR